MSDANSGDGKRRHPRRRHNRRQLSDAKLKELFLGLTKGEPSKEEIQQAHEMIDALCAVEDMDHAYKLKKVKELERMVGLGDEENKPSFTEREESRGEPPDSNQRK